MNGPRKTAQQMDMARCGAVGVNKGPVQELYSFFVNPHFGSNEEAYFA